MPKRRMHSAEFKREAFADNPDAFRRMFEVDQPERSSQRLAKAEHRAFRTLRGAVMDSIEAGHLNGDPNTLAHLYWASLHRIVVLDMANKLVHGRSKRTLLKSLFEGVLRPHTVEGMVDRDRWLPSK